MNISRDAVKIEVRPIAPGMEVYGELEIRMYVPVEVARRAHAAVRAGTGPFCHGDIVADDGLTLDASEDVLVSCDVLGCGLQAAVCIENGQLAWISAHGGMRRDGDDALDGTLGFPQAPGAADWDDARVIFKELLAQAAKD